MYTVIRMMLIVALAALASTALAEEAQKANYGDYCPTRSQYGTADVFVPVEEARAAIKDYYKDEKVQVMYRKLRGRFIEADIVKDGRILDTIVFDRKTGRLRSIY